MKYSRCFLHVDMDAFFASVEQLDHPEWKGKPVIVGGLPGEPRSVVSTASYEARKFGVHSAMPIVQAVKLCPNGIYTHGNYNRYLEISTSIMDILKQYSPDVNQLSIDEASIDLTGTEMLFGEPDSLALKIKEEIFAKTGLTVSAGLASTPYHAKLSSEVNKPNGFFAIPEGQEEAFMLNLPLKKVWGIGDKTLQRLNKCGFFTTKDIHEKPLNLLKMMFGEGTGTFLYNTVRGIYEEGPSKPQSHSISNETTFPVDVTDIYTAETALLELCYSVMFRLLRQKSFSKTVMVKIRYEDFSTISIQHTFEEYVSSSDDLFEKARALFEKKYEFGRGIRLIGVGLENVQDQNAPVQEVLFDFGEKKKKAVENAILKMTAKHPEIKVKKARMLSAPFEKLKVIGVFLILSLIVPFTTKAEEYQTNINSSSAAALNSPFQFIPLPQEAPKTLFDYSIGSNEIEFITQGWWQGDLTGSLNSTYSKENGFSTSSPSVVFKQQVDLSLWFMLNRQWYLETSFADEFNRNTIAAGFYGKETNPLKSIKIANRGIFFPDTYSLSVFNRGIGGGQNQAPGIMANFKDPVKNQWQADFALRYDMVSQQEATFYGKNSVNTSKLSLSNYITGQLFTLPEEAFLIQDIKTIYVEAYNGSLKDSSGRKFKELSSDQFLVIPGRNLIILSKDSGIEKKNGKLPAIAVAFNSTHDFSSELGSYSLENTFLGKVQKAFPSDIDLNKFSANLTGSIDGTAVIFLQENTGFSPFIYADYYDTGIGNFGDVLLGSTFTERQSSSYAAEITEDFQEFLSSSFINEKHLFVKIYNNLISEKTFSPQVRYPLAQILPGIYLNYPENTDLALIVRTYSPVSSYSIGTDAASGSVRVYKNGILDSSAKYDPDSGTVTLSTTVSQLDKIYITWNVDSGSAENGSLALQAGFRTALGKYATQDLSAAFNWTVSPYAKFAQAHQAAQGYAALGTGTTYKRNTIELSNALGFTFEKQNVTDLYRIEGFEDAESKTYYLGENALNLLSENILPSLNIQEGKILLAKENNYTVLSSNQKAVKDSFISGYKVPLEWNFPADAAGLPWAAVNVKLSSGYLLKNADSLAFGLQVPESVLQNYNIYLQLGVQAQDQVSYEASGSIPTWKISQANFDPKGNAGDDWHTVVIGLNRTENSMLSTYTDGRLVITPKNYNEEFKGYTQDLRKGTICFGPYEIKSKGMFHWAKDSLNVAVEQEIENSIPSKNTFNPDKNNLAQKISWNSTEELSTSHKILLSKYFEEADFSVYKKLQFYFKNPSIKDFELLLDTDSLDITSEGKTCIKATIKDEVFAALSKDSWHTLTIQLQDKKLFIDDVEITADKTLFVDTEVLPTRIRLSFLPLQKKDSFYIDELHLKDTIPDFILEDTAKIILQKKGVFLKAGNFAVLEDALFETKNNAGSRITQESGTTFINSSSKAQITLAGLKFFTQIDLSSQEKNLLSSVSHSVETANAIAGMVSFSDKFVFLPQDSSIEKASSAAIDFSRVKIPATISADFKSENTPWNNSSAMNLNQNINFNIKNSTLRINAGLSANQKNPVHEKTLKETQDKNYFNAYLESSKESFNAGHSQATLRNVGINGQLSWEFKLLSLKPSVSFQTENKYTSTSSCEYLDNSTFSFSVPFNVAKQNFQLKYQKNSSGTKTVSKGGDYQKDFTELNEALWERDFFLKAPPVYDLFAKTLPQDMSHEVLHSQTEKLYYSGLYSFSWKHSVFNNLKDLFIPSSLECSAQRQISVAETQSDFYILKASVINTPFNLFGSQGTSRLFNWYKTDEFIISLTGTAKIPAENPENTLWNGGFYCQSGIYISDTNILKTGNQFTLETDLSWKCKNSLLYKRNSTGKTKLNDTDSLDIDFNYSNEKNELDQGYLYSHLTSIFVTDNLTVNAGASAELKITKALTTIITSITLGGKLTF